MKNRVAISGMEVISPFGYGRPVFENGLYSGTSAIGDITRFDTAIFRSRRGGQVPEHGPSTEKPSRRFLSYVMSQAFHASGLTEATGSRELAAGLILPVVTGQTEHSLSEAADDWLEEPLEAIADPEAFLPFGRVHRITSACASISSALAMGWSMIRHGQLDIVVIARAEILNVYDFASMDIVRAISLTDARPFDAERNGIMIGEGAGTVILESERSLAARRGQALAWLDGAASYVGGADLNMIDLDKPCVVECMKMSLAIAGADRADYIHAHATGTPQGDAYEAEALFKAMDDAGNIPVSSHKGATGHLLRCSGFLGIAAGIASLRTQCLPPTAGLEIQDPHIRARLLTERLPQKTSSVLVNNFGFCGNYASVFLRHSEAESPGRVT
ncbi:beta-ketoacyl synthase [Paenibacillus thiaminolyticus]|uniref:Ketoacyl-ACP synthase n=1 Tax=Paenibacillus thiaminolyticus TaxID=49283 RepID=A0A3A3GF61_PANTH|nr:beta-ketoacyl synthase N-terminal-like domain-containing protein [Paenibacillus thiaminolyticus]RJG21711.1 ketoacyl-ACP synthase [Paenibacillus thiaminolyticus]